MRYAQILDGVVVSLLESDIEIDEPHMRLLDDDSMPNLGDLYDDESDAFTTPAPVPALRHITTFAFVTRFTDAEYIALDLASIGPTQQAAALRRYMTKAQTARFIDLERADTRAGVQALEAAGMLAAGRAAEILDMPIDPSELP